MFLACRRGNAMGGYLPPCQFVGVRGESDPPRFLVTFVHTKVTLKSVIIGIISDLGRNR